MTRDVRVIHTADLIDLMRAYFRIKTKDDFQPLHLRRGPVYTMEQALERMKSLIGHAIEWGTLQQFLPEGWQNDAKFRRSATAATFAASLELVKAGKMEIRQSEMFAPIEVRRKGNAHG